MFCLRSWLPLLFIPTNASPVFIFLFFVCTYFLNRPCVYCSFLLLILFMTSCNWSDRCFFDFSSNWFQARPSLSYLAATTSDNAFSSTSSSSSMLGSVQDMRATANATALVAKDLISTSANALVGAAAEQAAQARAEWTGIGMEWLRSLLGKREWRIDCLDLYIRL
ncbi:bladder cancer-related protein BC10-domain-containing protein [Coniella lustricola]|uniref:Bladder cancer-related protein BC10-domain-containing protein n=1 Tax=Coniella lustricola TaxID=2025994 RepID=A0A2T2ZW23_9PEZI|nr:bladder cancer-related protein BC10-domain-containing protein [Coniella lustricola]